MQSLQSYKQAEPVYDNNGYAISSTYHGGQLKMYCHSIAQPNGPRSRLEYYTHQLRQYAMTHHKDTFLDGAKAFRNAGDLAREYRNAAITRANEVAGETIKYDEG